MVPSPTLGSTRETPGLGLGTLEPSARPWVMSIEASRPNPIIDVVVPCYDEADRFELAAFDGYLRSNPSVRFTLVNDGSRDATLSRLQALRARWTDRVEVIDLPRNRGKGEAVRVGVRSAIDRGARLVGYWDADLATPLSAIEEARRVLEERDEVDIVLGARVALLGRRIRRKATRHYLGRVFATAASITVGLPVYDTQCGAKLMRVTPQTRGLFDAPFASRWVFDVELIVRYLQAHDLRADGLYELPLTVWTDVGASKVKPWDFVRALGDLARIYRRYGLAHSRARSVEASDRARRPLKPGR